MPPLSVESRQAIVNRYSGGQKISGAAGIATTMGVSIKTIYKLLREFEQEDGSYTLSSQLKRREDKALHVSIWLNWGSGYKLHQKWHWRSCDKSSSPRAISVHWMTYRIPPQCGVDWGVWDSNGRSPITPILMPNATSSNLNAAVSERRRTRVH